MEYTQILGTEIKVSRIGLGTWAIGGMMWGGTDEKVSIDTIITAIEKGINLMDTAPAYGDGVSEQIIGKAIRKYGNRSKIVLATKAGLEFTIEGKIRRNASSDRIIKEAEESLKRLGTDYIDIYQIHWPDYNVAIEETAVAMSRLFERGIIRAIGVSNFSPEQMDLFRAIAPMHASQPPYNLFEREIEKDVLPYCKDNRIAILAYGAICRGLLSGRMKPDSIFKDDDIRRFDPKFKEPAYSRYLEAVNLLDLYALENYGKRVIHLAVRWILDMGAEIALWGARTPAQLDPVEDIFGWHLSETDMEEIDGILADTLTENISPDFMAPKK